MNKLNCQVTSCQNNDACLCTLTKIKVDGPGAKAMEQTCCSSFLERTGGSLNSSACGSATSDTAIDCKAEGCSYNRNCKCTAGVVSVGCCSSLPSVMSETECCTFCCK